MRKLKELLKSATYRHLGYFSWGGGIKLFLSRRCFRPVVTLYLCQFFYQKKWPLRIGYYFSRMLHRFCLSACAMDFNWKAKVGYGLCINHGWGVVIGYGVTIGNNVTIYQGVTIGRVMRVGSDGTLSEPLWPVIEDDVWIGPNVVIVGDVVIGKGSRIAANTFINKSVAPYSIVAVSPCRVVKENCTPDVANRYSTDSLKS